MGTVSGAYQVDFIVGDLNVWTHRCCTCGDCVRCMPGGLYRREFGSLGSQVLYMWGLSDAYQVDFTVGNLGLWAHRCCTCGDCVRCIPGGLYCRQFGSLGSQMLYMWGLSDAYQADFTVGNLGLWAHRCCTCGDCQMHTRRTLL